MYAAAHLNPPPARPRQRCTQKVPPFHWRQPIRRSRDVTGGREQRYRTCTTCLERQLSGNRHAVLATGPEAESWRGRISNQKSAHFSLPEAACFLRVPKSKSSGMLERLPECEILHADKGYDANAIRRQVEERGAIPNIPPKANRKWKNCFSPFLYRNRNAIERMFCRLKDFRRVATRYDRNAVNFLAAVCIAAAVSYWL
jgi:transposase